MGKSIIELPSNDGGYYGVNCGTDQEKFDLLVNECGDHYGLPTSEIIDNREVETEAYTRAEYCDHYITNDLYVFFKNEDDVIFELLKYDWVIENIYTLQEIIESGFFYPGDSL